MMNIEYRMMKWTVNPTLKVSSNIKPLLSSEALAKDDNLQLSAPVWIFKINASYLHPAEQETQRINILTKKYYVSKN